MPQMWATGDAELPPLGRPRDTEQTERVPSAPMAFPTVTTLTLPPNLAVWPASPRRCARKPSRPVSPLPRINAPEPVDVPVSATEAPLRMSLQEVMALYKVPGLSMAIVDGYRITQAKAYGVTDAASRTPVTSKTLFQGPARSASPWRRPPHCPSWSAASWRSTKTST